MRTDALQRREILHQGKRPVSRILSSEVGDGPGTSLSPSPPFECGTWDVISIVALDEIGRDSGRMKEDWKENGRRNGEHRRTEYDREVT